MEELPATDGAAVQFTFIGAHLSLDFANTLGGFRGGSTQELLSTYPDLLVWGRQAGALPIAAEQGLLQEGQREPAQATSVLARAHHLREAIYRLVTAHMHTQPPHDTDLALLNAELALALPHRRVMHTAATYNWAWADAPRHLDAVLWPVATAAADVLIATAPTLVRECASERCSWLFLDTTRNHSRRWCDMKGCGNQAKIRRYRQRRG